VVGRERGFLFLRETAVGFNVRGVENIEEEEEEVDDSDGEKKRVEAIELNKQTQVCSDKIKCRVSIYPSIHYP
jgi:hypothetical protein